MGNWNEDDSIWVRLKVNCLCFNDTISLSYVLFQGVSGGNTPNN